MLGLTIRQPWAALVAAADPRVGAQHVKRVEMRGHRPARQVAGEDFLGGAPFAVHAGGTLDELGDTLLRRLQVHPLHLPPQHSPTITARGAIIAVARLVGCERLSAGYGDARRCVSAALDDAQARVVLQALEFDGYGWALDDVVLLERPVEARGMPGVWVVPPDVEQRVRAALPQAGAR